MGSPNLSVRRFEFDILEHSSRETSIRDTHTNYSSKDQDGTGRTQGGYIIGATDPSMGPGTWRGHLYPAILSRQRHRLLEHV